MLLVNKETDKTNHIAIKVVTIKEMGDSFIQG